MMMTLRALQPLAKEELRRVFQLRSHGVRLPIPGDGRVVLDVPGGTKDFTDELVVRLVLGEAFTNPRMERKGSTLVSCLGALVSQERSPFVRKIVRVIWTVEQRVDPAPAFVGICIR